MILLQVSASPEDKETGTCVVLLQYQVCCPKCTDVPLVLRRVSGQPAQSVSDLTRIHRGNRCRAKHHVKVFACRRYLAHRFNMRWCLTVGLAMPLAASFAPN